MPAVTADDFGEGLDTRRKPAVASVKSLRKCLNGIVTEGRICRKRPGSSLHNALEVGTHGLYGAKGKLNTFYHSGMITHSNSTYNANKLVGSVDVAVPDASTVLDDMTSKGDFTGTPAVVFEIEIDSAGSPDTFKWKKGSGSYVSGVQITGSDQNLSDGVSIKFGAATGHTLGDKWTINARVIGGIEKIHFVDVFQGFLYVVAEYDDGHVKHHYLDGSSPTWIEDTNCPNTTSAIKIATKIFAIKDDGTVPFSASGNPRDWTLANDAGFLPAATHQEGAEEPLALGEYQKNGLVVLFRSGGQLWNVDPDPALHSLTQKLPGAHTQYPGSVIPFSTDLFYLSDQGIRSVGRRVLSEDLNEDDVGSPVDKDIKEALAQAGSSVAPISIRYQNIGRVLWAIGDRVFVYGFSRTAKISPWAEWSFPFTIDSWARFQGDLYIREGNNVHKMDEDLYQDNGVTFRCKFWLQFLHAKTVGVEKYWPQYDISTTGEAELSFATNPKDLNIVTDPIFVTGPTYAEEGKGLEITSPCISPQIENEKNEEFEFDAITIYHENKGIQG